MDIAQRIKTIRKKNKLTQQEFADALKLKQNTIATYEMGRTIPSDRTILDICSKFNVREEWIRDGIGPMSPPPENEDAAYVDELLGKEENPLYDLIRAIMKTYSELGPKEQDTIKSFAKNLKANQNNEGRG